MTRVVILGTGTNVGKTYVTAELALALSRHPLKFSVTAIKPIESGTHRTSKWDGNAISLLASAAADPTPSSHPTDAAILASSSSPPFRPLHAYQFADPISPHLAARHSNVEIDLSFAVSWIEAVEAARSGNTMHATAYSAPNNGSHPSSSPREWLLVETAGAAFSPLGQDNTNLTLATSLEPAFWILVAPDRLGVLHDLTATLSAMKASSRLPDALILSQSPPTDRSTGTNAAELAHLRIANTTAVIPPNGSFPESATHQLIAMATAKDL